MPPVTPPTVDVVTPTVRVYDAVKARLTIPVERSYVTVGAVPLETRCSQFVVAAQRIYAGTPGAPTGGAFYPHQGYVPFTLELVVAYSECFTIPAKGIDPPAKEDAKGRAALDHAQQVVSAVLDAFLAGELIGDCSNMAVGPATFLSPEGGVSGVTLVVSLQLN